MNFSKLILQGHFDQGEVLMFFRNFPPYFLTYLITFSRMGNFIRCIQLLLETIRNVIEVPVLVGSNSGEGILNSGKYILQPDLLGEEYAEEVNWDEDKGPFYIFDRYCELIKINKRKPPFRIPTLNKSDYGPCDVLVSQKARQFYFNGNITADDLKQFINLNTDVQFW